MPGENKKEKEKNVSIGSVRARSQLSRARDLHLQIRIDRRGRGSVRSARMARKHSFIRSLARASFAHMS